ncbi:hypothetical protein GUITHDRAFT_75075 [Guillardia theta CCMP2712]|uniref:Aminotransferase class I/classII large domain-containing protein n=1 Tax=Guillardia theta (strain CCMP2712) TaxID=905079 RepID=L1IYP3_GUITC|nr:hypothetical protein GUITHDRAFT_75075 [Guillardia theta CCMP2712]EKX40945.1 hypothetical protein GUITHDRAFT_75075 [Guillardia theta CCMP2712]|eukprot:XP_005827925.1 hypothetical protein GUITHDRAFT_75075 [Guillardia theta CCMP2712]
MIREEGGKGGREVLSLAQGIVHWKPPPSACEAAMRGIAEEDTHRYGPDGGINGLVDLMRDKIRNENHLVSSSVMITAGSNQAYMNVVLTLLDEGDTSLLLIPYYFNHLMALQMTGARIELAPTTKTLQPDLDWLRQRLGDVDKPKVKELRSLCASSSVWLVCDTGYEYENVPHACVEGENVLNLFSFSKSYGMMGWRVGCVAMPLGVEEEMLKAQDTIPICPPILSQKAAAGAMEAGRKWVKEKVRGLWRTKKRMRGMLVECLGEEAVLGGSGAIYLMVKLPESMEEDEKAVEWLVKKHQVCVIPGSACGFRGHVRVCYSNLSEERCEEAIKRLRSGLEEMKSLEGGKGA